MQNQNEKTDYRSNQKTQYHVNKNHEKQAPDSSMQINFRQKNVGRIQTGNLYRFCLQDRV